MKNSEYWIGEEVDYDTIWNAYESGLSYIDKFRSIRVHLLSVELTEFDSDLPLFNHEAVYKTIKGYFHDFKRVCLTPSEYDQSGPLFLYSVNRGSGIWNFLGEPNLIVTFAMTLAAGKILGEELADIETRLKIIQQYFPDTVNPAHINSFMRARTPAALRAAVGKLIAQGIKGVGVSQLPFDGNFRRTARSIVNIQQINAQGIHLMSESIGRDKITAARDSIAIGGSARVSKSDFKKIWHDYRTMVDLNSLTKELTSLRNELRKQVLMPEHDIVIGQVAEAEIAATAGDGPTALMHLRNAGKWALDIATKIGATLAAEAIKKAMGL